MSRPEASPESARSAMASGEGSVDDVEDGGGGERLRARRRRASAAGRPGAPSPGRDPKCSSRPRAASSAPRAPGGVHRGQHLGGGLGRDVVARAAEPAAAAAGSASGEVGWPASKVIVPFVIGRKPVCLSVQPTALNRRASSASSCLRVRLSCEWIWQTRLSDTPRMSPISRSVRFLT